MVKSRFDAGLHCFWSGNWPRRANFGEVFSCRALSSRRHASALPASLPSAACSRAGSPPRCRDSRSPASRPRAVPAYADLSIECASASMLERICRPMLQAGKQVMVLSAGALLPRPHLTELAKHGKGRSSSRAERCRGSMRAPRRPKAVFPPGLLHPVDRECSLAGVAEPDGSPRCRYWQHCASSLRPCELELELSLCK
jgi:hypothetical protein